MDPLSSLSGLGFSSRGIAETAKKAAGEAFRPSTRPRLKDERRAERTEVGYETSGDLLELNWEGCSGTRPSFISHPRSRG